MPDFFSLLSIDDLAFLHAMRISPGDPELATPAQVRQCLMGTEYWALMERTAARVAKWPAWKAGIERRRR